MGAPANAWWKRTTIDAFDAATKGRAWPSARRAVVALGLDLSGDPSGTGDEPEVIVEAAGTAIDYGCEDPLVWHAKGRALRVLDPSSREAGFATGRAGVWFRENRAYPPIRRCLGLLEGARAISEAFYYVPNAPPIKAPEYADAAVALYPEVVADPDLPTHDLLRLGRVAGDASAALRGGRDRSLVDPLLAALDRSKQPRSKVLTVRGQHYLQLAWDARGSGLADTVGEAGWEGFKAYSEMARDSLAEAWRLDNADPEPAALMIRVVMGLSGDRKEMEQWYVRATTARPGHAEAIKHKMFFLEPKWHGGPGEMIEFGRELAKTTTADPRTAAQTLALVDAHWTLAWYTGWDVGLPHPAYFARFSDAWEDVRAASEAYLAREPGSRYHRTRYAVIAAWAGKWDVADAQFDRLGDAFSTRVVEADVIRALRAQAKRPPATRPAELRT